METAEEGMKMLGLFGIGSESHKILARSRNIFNQIALAFILPLCFIILAQTTISKIQFSSTKYKACGEHKYRSIDRVVHIRLNLPYSAFPFIFSLLSSSAVVYTIACIYANHDVSFKKVMSALPEVCIRKRLIVTFTLIYVLIFVYIAVAAAAIAVCSSIVGSPSAVLSFILLIGCMIGLVYITTVLQLASVVTILEESYGLEAIKRSRNLTKGKFRVALCISLMLHVLVWTINFVFYNIVLHEIALGMWKRGLVGLFCLAILVTLYLYVLALQTVTYFVCKSYHNEYIDKPTLSQHLAEYEDLYIPDVMKLKQIYWIALTKAIEGFNVVLDQLINMH